MTGADVMVGRVRASAPAQSSVAARLAVEALLGTLPTSAPGAPPQSICIVRKLALSVPAYGLVCSPDAGALQRFGVAAELALQEALRGVVRPARERASSEAAAVLFADEAELLACLIRDAARGELDRWWWRVVLARRYPDWTTELTLRAYAMPGALRILKSAGLEHALAAFVRTHMPNVQDLSPQPTAAVTASGVEQMLLREPGEIAEEVELKGVPRRLERVSDGGSRQRQRVLALGAASMLSPPERLALPSRHAASIVSLEKREELGLEHATRAALAAAQPPTGSLTSQSEEASLLDHALAAISTVPLGVSPEGAPSYALERSAPAYEPGLPTPVGAGVALIDGDTCARLDAGQRGEASPTLQPPMARDAPRLAAARSPEGPRKHYAAVTGASEPSLEPALEVALPAVELDPVRTRYGGVFYLVNVFLAQGMYPDFTRPVEAGFPIPLWELLMLASQRLLGARFRRDPLHPLLTRLGDEAPRGSGELDELWAVPSTIRTARHTDLSTRWVDGFVRWLRRELCVVLGYPPLQAAKRLAYSEARVWVTPGEVVVAHSLDAHDVRIRLAGIDRNPGFLPSVGYCLRFTYE